MISLTPASIYCLFSISASAVALVRLSLEHSRATEVWHQQSSILVSTILMRRSNRLELLSMIKTCLRQTVKADRKAGQAQRVPPYNRAMSAVKAEKIGSSYHCSSSSSNSSEKCLLRTNSPSCRTGGHRKAGALTLI